MITFGAGIMIGTQTYDGNGNAVAVPTPIQFGILQEVTPDESFELKKLYGQYKFPVAVGQGKGTMSLKAKLANISAELHNTFMYGLSLASTYEAIYDDQTGTLITTALGEIITPTLNGTALADLGVVSAVNGVPYTRVATAPTSGQYGYQSGTGAWFFSAVDAGKKVFIDYAYGNSAITTGKNLVLTNQLMGLQPVFAVDLQTRYLGKTLYIHYPQVVATKLSRSWKNDDFTIYDLEMEAFADVNGVVADMYYYE